VLLSDNTKIELHLSHWTQWVKAVIATLPSQLPCCAPTRPTGLQKKLDCSGSRSLVKLLSAYCWLHDRFPALCPAFDSTREVISSANRFIANSLKRKIRRR
jgi:Mitochondrial degradasome RNA helicase subunit C terminal